MKFEGRLRDCEFVERPNRFAAYVSVDGKREYVHVPDSGRLAELLTPGRPGLLVESSNPDRITRYTLIAVKYADVWIYVGGARANDLFAEALPTLKTFAGYKIARREVEVPHGRIDFLLENDEGGSLYVEVKSVTLVEDGVGLFPDAPTARGKKHVEYLAGLGSGAAVVFVVQRPDCREVRPNEGTDPVFARALRAAAAAGVGLYAYVCTTGRGLVEVGWKVNVVI
ncbi:MAG: DNA/RNA nuclease SfsA [Candidatus Coatesbacteria bacterium]|nr:MAG: DNA/RNA nuclease SfsA [Candidatus Coatesbacteria bacterium]